MYNTYIRLPEYWSIEQIDFLLYFANELNNSIMDQFGDQLYKYWNSMVHDSEVDNSEIDSTTD